MLGVLAFGLSIQGFSHATETLPSVTVNARQGEERAKDVPFGIDVISGDELEARRLPTLESLLRGTPGVNVSSYGDPNSANVLIRGVGALNQVSLDDGAVALNIDGVAMSPRNMSLGTLDIERVEVLKGPQGTLFGGNSLAGAINVTSRRPTSVREGYLLGEVGSGREYRLEGVVSGPLMPGLSARLAVRRTGFDHWVRYGDTGQPLSRPGSEAMRATLSWQADPATTALVILERQVSLRNPAVNMLRPFGDPPALGFPSGVADTDRKTVGRYSVEVEHRFVASRVTGLTARTGEDYRAVPGYDARLVQALYGMASPYLRHDTGDQQVISQDLRWSSLPRDPVFWVLGANFSRSERHFDTRYAVDRQGRTFRTVSRALYGEITYPLAEDLKLTSGLRLSRDQKNYAASYVGPLTVDDARALNDTYTTGRVAVSKALSPSTNVYGVVSRGHQPGGFGDFSIQPSDSEPYAPSSSVSAEVGFKTESSPHRLSLNGALFLNRVKNAHLLAYDYTTFSTQTVTADTQSRGAELEGSWRPWQGFDLAAGLAWTDATITSDVLGSNGGDMHAGNRSPEVPRWSGRVGVAYRSRPLPGWAGLQAPLLKARVDYRFVGARAADPQNHFNLRAHRQVDARVALLERDIELYAYVNNVLNDRYDLYGYYNTPDVRTGAPARGRSAGVGLAYYF